MSFKKSIFTISQPLSEGIYLCTNSFSGCSILLNTDYYELYSHPKEQYAELKEQYPELFERLLKGGFIVNSEADELNEYMQRRINESKDTEMYQLVINPTLDCNLSCWYCYEHKIKNSFMDGSIVKGICRNITLHFNEVPYKLLKISFFGGEPFLRENVIKDIVSFADAFCKEKGVKLLLDFTTNGTRITDAMIDFLMPFECIFQITLDGNRCQHNKIKHEKDKCTDTYSLSLKNIFGIENNIKKSFVYVRINFDKETLNGFDSILNDIKSLDKAKTVVILKKVWQVNPKDIPKELITNAISSLLISGFTVDYYSQGGTCFADRLNEAVINYDGKVFKCTTINKFDQTNSVGKLDADTGRIEWYKGKVGYLYNNSIGSNCITCKLLPSCGGPCRKQISEGLKEKCFLKDLNISIKEFVKIQFMSQYLKHRDYVNK